MPKPNVETPNVGALDVVELLGALVACAVLVTAPVWLGALAGALLGQDVGILVFFYSFMLGVVGPALPWKAPPQLNGYQRWGLRMGRFFGTPMRWAARRRQLRNARALSALHASSSAAAPSLPPPRSSP